MSLNINSDYNRLYYETNKPESVKPDKENETQKTLDELSKRFANADISVGTGSSFPVKNSQKEFSIILSEDELEILKNGSDEEKGKLYKTIESSMKTLSDFSEKIKNDENYGKFDLGLSISNGKLISYLANDGDNSYSAGSLEDLIKMINSKKEEQED